MHDDLSTKHGDEHHGIEWSSIPVVFVAPSHKLAYKPNALYI